MISKNKQKLIHSLKLKKYRDELGLFVGEGPKVVSDLIAQFDCQYLICTASWLDSLSKKQIAQLPEEKYIVDYDTLSKVSFLKTPQEVLALFKKSRIEPTSPLYEIANHELCLALDGVQDPGNVGTIIRIADWFGIRHIFCSESTADAFSPKCVQATMGSISRVHLHYLNLSELISNLSCPVYGTYLEGDVIYQTSLTGNGIIIMGSEGTGISAELKPLVSQKLFIPSFASGNSVGESLNVGVATGIVCAEFRRQTHLQN